MIRTPGEHTIVFSSDPIDRATLNGGQVRDAFLVLAPAGILFGYVVRQPVEGEFLANLVKNGTGAFAIDACRKAWTSEAERLQALPGSMPKANRSIGTFETRDRSNETPEEAQSPLGRWPTNVLIVHHPDCLDTCVEGCYVPRIDAMSGHLESGVGAVKRSTAKGYQGAAYGKENRPVGTPMVSYGDSGGASRYYPQFRSYDELASWLGTLTQANLSR